MNLAEEIYSFFDNICRACLVHDESEMETLFSDNNKLSDTFAKCTSLPISTDDGLPTKLCKNCVDRLQDIHAFQEQCIRSDIALREQAISIKQEIDMCEVDIQIEALDTPIVISDNSHSLIRKPKLRKSQGAHVSLRSKIYKYSSHSPAQSETGKRNVNTVKKVRIKFELECNLCQRKFRTQEGLDGHLRIHNGKKPYICKECNKEFTKKNGLTQHMVLHQDAPKAHVCPHCSKPFHYRSGLNVHLKVHDTETTNEYICETCGKGFVDKPRLARHKLTHSKDCPFKCLKCSKAFKIKYKLNEHMKRHSGIKNYVCTTCGYRFVSTHELLRHMAFHTGAKPYSCALCGNNFPTKGNLDRHLRMHSGIRTFKCDLCERAFAKAETLKHHRMTHTGEKPHTCAICNKSFIQVTALKTHLKIHNKTERK